MLASLCLGILFTSLFIFLLFHEPRTLFLGGNFLLALGFLVLALLLAATKWQITILYSLLGILLTFLAISLLASPAILMLTLLIKGGQLIRREGRSLTNLLAFVLGLAMLFFPFFSRLYLDLFEKQVIMTQLYYLFLILLNYLVAVMSLYTVSSFLNFIHWKKQSLDYVVVLGSGLMGDKVTPLLASRIRKGIRIYQKHPNCKLILSGGQGADELLPEGEAMARYALQEGVPAPDIIIEDKSQNTRENLLFSSQLMDNDSHFAIATNYYHLFRALLTAKELGLTCIGYGAKTKFYFTLNAYIRELVGYLYLKRRLHLYSMGLISLFYLIARQFIF